MTAKRLRRVGATEDAAGGGSGDPRRTGWRRGWRDGDASWSSDTATWTVTLEAAEGAEPMRYTCGFLFACSGYYRYDAGYLPEFAGIGDFAGPVIHPQAWPDDLDHRDKRIVVTWTLRADLTSRSVCKLLNHMDERGADTAVPTVADDTMEPRPLLDLQSGYVRRGAAVMPKQGSKARGTTARTTSSTRSRPASATSATPSCSAPASGFDSLRWASSWPSAHRRRARTESDDARRGSFVMTARRGTGPTWTTDVIVVGGGNAGFCAAHAAAERGRRTVVLEKGSAAMAGGNSFFTAGATRIDHGGLDDLVDIVEPDDRHATTEVPPYPSHEYAADLAAVTAGRNDHDAHRCARHRIPGHRALAARTRSQVPAVVRTPGVPTSRRQLPVLRRCAHRQRRRRGGTGRRAHRGRRPARHGRPLRQSGDRSRRRGRPCRRCRRHDAGRPGDVARRTRSSSPPGGSSPTRHGGAGTSATGGSTPRSAARRTTRAT